MKKKTSQPKLQLTKIKVSSLSRPNNEAAQQRTLPITFIIICGGTTTSWICTNL
ncbi:hypothetical protein [Chitinophaga agrisoli]|uniref:hypothetical protein n=1 Tax=Chitinophaga agrisoli TaxID=2607653 RepID=UPI00166215C5|nr:hypothetical protein [Chitinophaga agrisoli]